MNYEQTASDRMRTTAATPVATDDGYETQYPLWLSAGEAELLLMMWSRSPVFGGELEAVLFRKIGRLIVSFALPHPK